MLENLAGQSAQTDSALGLNALKSNPYVNFLVEGGFIRILRKGKGIANYEITDKGREFLRDYRSLLQGTS